MANPLPTVGADSGVWGTKLNAFLSTEHDPATGKHEFIDINVGNFQMEFPYIEAPNDGVHGLLLSAPVAGGVAPYGPTIVWKVGANLLYQTGMDFRQSVFIPAYSYVAAADIIAVSGDLAGSTWIGRPDAGVATPWLGQLMVSEDAAHMCTHTLAVSGTSGSTRSAVFINGNDETNGWAMSIVGGRVGIGIGDAYPSAKLEVGVNIAINGVDQVDATLTLEGSGAGKRKYGLISMSSETDASFGIFNYSYGAYAIDINGTRFKTLLDLTFDDGKNIILDTTTGTKIGTAASQKLGFWNHAPAVQPTKAGHNNWAAVSDVVAALVAIGILDAA